MLVDITAVMGAKLKAVRAHKSQMVYLDERETANTFRLLGRMMAQGAPCLYGEGLYHLM